MTDQDAIDLGYEAVAAFKALAKSGDSKAWQDLQKMVPEVEDYLTGAYQAMIATKKYETTYNQKKQVAT
jgi:hypothetical protein